MSASPLTIREIDDERTPFAESALALIEEYFPPQDRQPLAELRMEIAEKRLGLLAAYNFHLLAAEAEDGRAAAVAVGAYLEGVNAGFVSYLAVDPEFRTRRLGRTLRFGLVEAFREDAWKAGFSDLAWVLGEVRRTSPWLHRLVRDRGAVPFDLEYYHPGVAPGYSKERWVLYRQPVDDSRAELPAAEVRRILYAVYRRVYRVRYPLGRPGFAAMFAELESRNRVGVDPELAPLAARP